MSRPEDRRRERFLLLPPLLVPIPSCPNLLLILLPEIPEVGCPPLLQLAFQEVNFLHLPILLRARFRRRWKHVTWDTEMLEPEVLTVFQ